MTVGVIVAAVAAAFATGGGGAAPEGDAQPTPVQRLERVVRPSRPVARRAEVTLGESSEGRPITAIARNGVPTSASRRPGGPLVLVFGCIHGDECAGVGAVERAIAGECPPPGDGLVVVPNLNPDGLALGTRLNGRGVDLNRNFGQDWRPGGAPGDLEYPGRRPFSEPETRIARQLIQALRPDVTIWFHQQAEPLVRAWGPSVAAARDYARLTGMRFVRLPWMDGTAPNWQNNRFPGSASFVVELPDEVPIHGERQAQAIFRFAITLMHRGHG
ncbi:MAG: M14 family zinc carboxypeptidase [Solirubrobacterales bacterium]